ncbi:MAG: rRNA maturation RNase YbeY [Clostridiales bacterium]|jgi:probable rRNA maturation factor|nr:rRNA maturation RNase YbeY [Clostridiales bacterium]
MLNIINETDIPVNEQLLSLVYNACLARFTAYRPSMDLTITINERVRDLNREYRGMDEPTDVLSFPMFSSYEEWDEQFRLARRFNKNSNKKANDARFTAGDIVISIERAQSQADEYGHSIERELGFLTAHGVLHIMGFDHENRDDEAQMFTIQEEVLTSLGLIRSTTP